MNKLHILISAACVLMPGTAMAEGGSCEMLKSLTWAGAKIDSAVSVPAGDLALTSDRRGQTRTLVYKGLPDFCRVSATLTPSPDSDIKVEVWLPISWNGKFDAVGNSGSAGAISYAAMTGALRNGYATASTDTGHSGEGRAYLIGHPEKSTDFEWRSEHEMTVKAKAIIAAFYNKLPKYSYWSGCSTGGRQGLTEAVRFPDDYDGFALGDPTQFRAELTTSQMLVDMWVRKDPANLLPISKLKVLHEAVLSECDALDGVKDRLIENPKACHFDPAKLTCKGQEETSCLTKEQVQTARMMLNPVKLSNGQVIRPGAEIGSELSGWAQMTGTSSGAPESAEIIGYVVYKDPNWDWKTFDADAEFAAAKKVDAAEASPAESLGKFLQHGKMVLTQGWNDAGVRPQVLIDYFNTALRSTPSASKSLRMFMVPGMGHCGGGEGATDKFDATAALDAWFEKGQAPERIFASHITEGKVDRTRPLCAYPKVAHYKGTGGADEEANFECKAPS